MRASKVGSELAALSESGTGDAVNNGDNKGRESERTRFMKGNF